MPERDAFGLPTVPDDENDEFAFLKDAQPETPVSPVEGEPEAPAAAPPVTPPAAPVVEPVEGEAGEVIPALLAGRYQTVEALEQGYRELRDLHRRTAERAKTYEDQSKTIQEHARELEATLQRAIPYLQRATQQQPADYQTDPYTGEVRQVQPQAQQLTPDMVATLVDQMVQERMAESRVTLAQQFESEREVKAAEDAVMGFYTRHPDVEPRGTVDGDIAETILTLNEAWGPTQSSVDISDPDSLEIAYEATQRPALRQVLEMNPEYFDTDAGMSLARFQASLLEGTPITQTTQQVPASNLRAGPAQVMSQSPPVTERAATGNAGNEADRPLDEFDQAALDYRKGRARGGGIFFE